MINNNSPSSSLRRLHLGERTVDASMKSTVILNKNTQQQNTLNNDNKISKVSYLLNLHNISYTHSHSNT